MQHKDIPILFRHDYFSLFARYLSDHDIRQLRQVSRAGNASGTQYLNQLLANPELLVKYLCRMDAGEIRTFLAKHFPLDSERFNKIQTRFTHNKKDLWLAACYALIGPAYDSNHITLMHAHNLLKEQGFKKECALMQSLKFQSRLVCFYYKPEHIQILMAECPKAFHNLQGIALDIHTSSCRKRKR